MNPALRFLTAQHWAIVPSVFESLVRLIERHADGIRASSDEVEEIRSAVRARRPAAGLLDMEDGGGEAAMVIRGDTAVIPIRGVIARYSDQVNGACQDQGRSAEAIQADLARAMNDPRVSRIVLRIDSPGGSVAGTAETGDAIRAARAAGKYVVAYVDGMAASAAYWLASQADRIVASSSTALVGSIGVITAYLDASKAQEARGYKLHVIRSVALKAPGTGNESLNPEQLASISGMIGQMHAAFTDAVASGRGLSDAQMATAATGEVFTAGHGISMGLVDAVASWSDVMDGDVARPNRSSATAQRALPSAATKSAAATPKEKPMPSSIEQVNDLIQKHPAHAVLISGMAAKDANEEQILAAVTDAEAKAKSAAEITDLKAKLAAADDVAAAAKAAKATAESAVIAAQAAQAKAEKERDDFKSKYEALSAHANGGKQGNTLATDGNQITPPTVTKDQWATMDAIAQSKHVAAGGAIPQ